MKNINNYKQFLNEKVSDEEVFSYLNDLRDSGQTNMFGAGAYIERAFNLDKRKARDLLTKWMKSFDEAKVNEAKTALVKIMKGDAEISPSDIKAIEKLPSNGKVTLTGDGVKDFATGMQGDLHPSKDNTYTKDEVLNWLSGISNEKVNEARRGEYPILSIGPTNLLTGKSKYWNFYDEWLKGSPMTCEIYEATGGKGTVNKFVFTSGKGTIDDIKPGGRREFVDDQTGRYLFDGVFIGSAELKDLKHWANENGIKSGTGYVYK